MLTFLQLEIEIIKREMANCNFVVGVWLYYGLKKKMVQKSMSGTADFVHILKRCLRADSISKLMNTKWITYVFAMNLLRVDTSVWHFWRDNSSYFSFTQTEKKQNDLNFMAKTLNFSSLELYSRISSI